MLIVDTQPDTAEEGTATPEHTTTAMDTRLLNALESLKASIEWDDRSTRYCVYTEGVEGYRTALFGKAGESLRSVLQRWYLCEKPS